MMSYFLIYRAIPVGTAPCSCTKLHGCSVKSLVDPWIKALSFILLNSESLQCWDGVWEQIYVKLISRYTRHGCLSSIDNSRGKQQAHPKACWEMLNEISQRNRGFEELQHILGDLRDHSHSQGNAYTQGKHEAPNLISGCTTGWVEAIMKANEEL